jgi:endoglucanase
VLDKEVFMGWGKLLANYDSYYEFKDLKDVYISKIRLYDGQATFASQPFKLYAKSSASATPVLLTTFTGDSYGEWVEVTLPKPVQAQYLVLNTWWGFPTEMELVKWALIRLYGNFCKTTKTRISVTGCTSLAWR